MFPLKHVGDHYSPTKIPFTGRCGLQVNVNSALENFLCFFDTDIVDSIVCVRHTDMQNTTFKVLFWSPGLGLETGSQEDIYMTLGISILMEMIQKLTHKSYFSKDAFHETPIFGQSTILERLELTTNFVYHTRQLHWTTRNLQNQHNT
jgi:hypothetical protein